MGYEKASKSEKETQFQNMIETFQNEKKELDGELNFLRERYLIYEENIYSIIYLKIFLYAYVIYECTIDIKLEQHFFCENS